MMTELPKNTDALLYQLEAEMTGAKTMETAQEQLLLRSYFNRAALLRNERITKIQERMDASGGKAKLKAKIAELSVFRAIKEVGRRAKASISRWNNFVKTMERERSRRRESLQEIDKNKTDLVSKNVADLSAVFNSNAAAALNQALSASVSQLHETQRLQDTQQSIGQNQVTNAIENQKTHLQKQLDILKKSKIFGFIFKILSVILQAIPEIGVFLAQAAQVMHQFVMLSLKNSMADQQMSEQNSAQDVQRILKNILQQDQSFKKSQTTEEEVLGNLESSERGILWK